MMDSTNTAPLCAGAYLLIHQPSNLLLVGHCSNLAHNQKLHFDRLEAGVHANRELQELYDQEKLVAFEFYPTATREQAQALAQSLVLEHESSGRLLEPGKRYLQQTPLTPKHYNS